MDEGVKISKGAFRKSKTFTAFILYKTRNTHSIKLKPSQMDFWQNFFTFKQQKNTGVTKRLTWARWSSNLFTSSPMVTSLVVGLLCLWEGGGPGIVGTLDESIYPIYPTR